MHERKVTTSHALGALLEAGIIALLILTVVVGPAAAARGGKAPATPVTISVADSSFGETAFATVTGASGLYVRVECMQGGATNYVAVERTGSEGTAAFQMGPTPTWASGAADCTAQAGHFDRRGRWLVDASTSFAVAP